MYKIKPTSKKNFLADNPKLVTAAFVIFIAALILIWSGRGGSLASAVMSPFLKAGDSVYGAFKMPVFLKDKSDLEADNQKLREDLENNLIEMADYEALKQENQQLRTELRLKPAGDFLAAKVLAKPPQIPLDTFFIDRGSRDGLKEGNFVFAGDRVLLGKVVKVTPGSATVALNSFAGNLTYGYLVRTGEPLEVTGEGGAALKSKVPIDFDIEVGDRVMANGSGSFLVGTVKLVEEDVSSGNKDVFISMPVDVSKINIVFIEPANI